MENRQKKILQLVVESFVKSAEPVGSRFLAEKSSLGVKEATIRNELRAMEEDGYLTHPHTSAGRIPTQDGYIYYVENIMSPGGINEKIKNKIKKELRENKDLNLKSLGKIVADISNLAVIIAFGRDDIYYTGLSNLFSQVEFREYGEVIRFSQIFDQVDAEIDNVFDLFGEHSSILVGNNNPFGADCSLVGRKIKNILFTIMGPIRMDYSKNAALLDYISELSQ